MVLLGREYQAIRTDLRRWKVLVEEERVSALVPGAKGETDHICGYAALGPREVG